MNVSIAHMQTLRLAHSICTMSEGASLVELYRKQACAQFCQLVDVQHDELSGELQIMISISRSFTARDYLAAQQVCDPHM